MVEVLPHTLGNSVIRFYLCLSIIWTCASAECQMNDYGSLYMGTRNETKSGKACQKWTSNSPHPVAGDIMDDQFPDNSRAEANNFCRNPQPLMKHAVWCYTMDPAVEWEFCFECREEYQEYGGCTLADKGASYTGRLDRAISHMRCEPWSDHPDPRFVFPDGSAEKAKNFCRNPLPGDYSAPWCYVPIFGHPNWEYCDICRPFQGQIAEVSTGIIPRHLLRASFAESSCIAFCITHQTCVVAVMERVRYGIECYYSTSVGGEIIKVGDSHNVTQYEISRVCVARAKGAAGYFVNMPNVGDSVSLNRSLPWELMSLEECDKKCLQSQDCVMFNYYIKNSSCCILEYESDFHVLADGFMERHIVRCNPALPLETEATNEAIKEYSEVCIMTNYGSLYMGTRNETKSGKACQEWTSNSPHPVAGDITDDQFPDNSRAEAKNFCRNPQPTLKPAVWCYTMDPAVEWELCFECQEEYKKYGGCTLADKGASYIGRLDRAISHMVCQPWSDHPDPRFVFPDGSAEKAENFCRNPHPGNYSAPWCYVPIFGHPNWDYCDICRPFQGQITELSTAEVSKNVRPAEFVGGSCIAFCITHQTCVVAVIERVRYGIECYYSTSVGGETLKVEDGHNVTQYEISRVCVARAKGAAGYFVSMPNVANSASLGIPLEFMSLEECDKKCLQNPNCVMFNYYTKDSSCCILEHESEIHLLRDGCIERHIVRCNPALEAINYDINPGISTTLETPTTFDNISTNEATSEAANDAIKANSEDEAENVATNKAANEAADEANEPTSKDEHATVATTNPADHQKNIILIVIIAVGVLLILVCACCGFAFYRYNKRKTGSDEKKPLIDQTSAKETNQTKTGEEKLTISKSTSPLKIKKSAAGVSAVRLQMMQSTPQRTPQAMQTAPAVPIQIMKSTPGGTPQAMQTAPAVPLQTMNSTPGGTPQSIQTAPAGPQAIQGAPSNVIKTTPG